MSVVKSVVVLLSLLTIVAGCSANRHKVACAGEDWHQMGYDFASKGESVRLFNKYRDQCGENLEDGAMSAYLDGYTKGVIEHCTYEKGYDRGYNNKQAFENCPVEMQALYAQGYKEGHAAHGRRIAELEETMRQYERYYDNQQQRMHHAWEDAERKRIAREGP